MSSGAALAAARERSEGGVVAAGLALEVRDLDQEIEVRRAGGIQPALEHLGEEAVIAALARELLERVDGWRVAGVVTQRLLEVLDRGLLVGNRRRARPRPSRKNRSAASRPFGSSRSACSSVALHFCQSPARS